MVVVAALVTVHGVRVCRQDLTASISSFSLDSLCKITPLPLVSFDSRIPRFSFSRATGAARHNGVSVLVARILIPIFCAGGQACLLGSVRPPADAL